MFGTQAQYTNKQNFSYKNQKHLGSDKQESNHRINKPLRYDIKIFLLISHASAFGLVCFGILICIVIYKRVCIHEYFLSSKPFSLMGSANLSNRMLENKKPIIC